MRADYDFPVIEIIGVRKSVFVNVGCQWQYSFFDPMLALDILPYVFKRARIYLGFSNEHDK